MKNKSNLKVRQSLTPRELALKGRGFLAPPHLQNKKIKKSKLPFRDGGSSYSTPSILTKKKKIYILEFKKVVLRNKKPTNKDMGMALMDHLGFKMNYREYKV